MAGDEAIIGKTLRREGCKATAKAASSCAEGAAFLLRDLCETVATFALNRFFYPPASGSLPRSPIQNFCNPA
jgi:hypothetical protein